MATTASDRAVLERLLGVPEMAWLLERVRARAPASGGLPLSGVVRLVAPSDGQRAAMTKLVGRPKRPGRSLGVELADVEDVLRRGPWPAGLVDAVVTLTGPVVDRAAERDREAAAWNRAAAGLADAERRFPVLAPWWQAWCASGGLKRSVAAEAKRTGSPAGPDLGAQLVDSLARVLDSLPAPGVPLAVFARSVVGDAHGLDASRPLGRLAAAAVGAAFGRPQHVDVSRRDAWLSAGVVWSNVSSLVLALGIDGVPDAGRADVAQTGVGPATSLMLTAMRAARSPVVLTLDQVRSGGVVVLPPDAAVYVCENPAIVEVTARRWASAPAISRPAHAPGAVGEDHESSPVLVCTSGQPSTAVIELLERLTSGGAACRYHGDFDWAGIRIARALQTRVRWTPWRFTADDYRAGLSRGASSVRLSSDATETPWDPGLEHAMSAAGVAVEEEAVADLLADDVLASRRRGRP